MISGEISKAVTATTVPETPQVGCQRASLRAAAGSACFLLHSRQSAGAAGRWAGVPSPDVSYLSPYRHSNWGRVDMSLFMSVCVTGLAVRGQSQ